MAKLTSLTMVLLLLAHCVSMPKPVTLTGNENKNDKEKLYQKNKVIEASFLSAPKVNNEYSNLSEIMNAFYISQETKSLWSTKITYLWLGMPMSGIGGYLIGYNLITPNRNDNQLYTGIGVAILGLVFVGISDVYQNLAGNSYNQDLAKFLEIDISNNAQATNTRFNTQFNIRIASHTF